MCVIDSTVSIWQGGHFYHNWMKYVWRLSFPPPPCWPQPRTCPSLSQWTYYDHSFGLSRIRPWAQRPSGIVLQFRNFKTGILLMWSKHSSAQWIWVDGGMGRIVLSCRPLHMLVPSSVTFAHLQPKLAHSTQLRHHFHQYGYSDEILAHYLSYVHLLPATIYKIRSCIYVSYYFATYFSK